MQNQNDDEYNLDDDFYDEAIDEGFEEDFDDSDLELESDDFAEDDLEEEWDVSEEAEHLELGAGQEKQKSNFSMSFNAKVITGAVILGFCVLGYQLTTTESTIVKDTFQSILKMRGATDGEVFGDQKVETSDIADQQEALNQNGEQGFLHNPTALDTMEIDLSDTPPMPTPISAEEPETVENIELIDLSKPSEASKAVESKVPDIAHIPRAPDEEDEFPNMRELLKVDNANVQNEITAPVNNVVVPTKKITANLPIKKEAPISQPVVTTAQPVQDNSALETKLEMIVSRLDDMDLKITQIRETGNLKIEDISDDLEVLKKDLGQLGGAPVKKTVSKAKPQTQAKTKAVVKSSPASQAKPKNVVRAKTVKVVWELRAAQPGKAWVSKKGHEKMQPVVIGDRLKGIGRITAISYNGSRWVVQGTSGRILQ